MRFKIIAFCCIFSTTVTANEPNNTSADIDYPEETEDLRRRPIGFFFSMPKTLLFGRNETACLTVHHSIPSKILVDIKVQNQHFFTTRSLHTEHTCFELTVPSVSTKEAQVASVRVQLTLDGAFYSSHNQDPVLIYPNKKLTFVETDRKIYKAGDWVKIRVLSLEDNLLPPTNYKVSIIRIRNPFDIIVAVWENVSTNLGLTQLEYQLSKDSMEGKWKIETEDETRAFEVTRYVIPRFNVVILHPRVIYFKEELISVQVCSRYTFGAQVKGSAFLRILDSHSNMKPSQKIQELKEGCATFQYTNDDLSLAKVERLLMTSDAKVALQMTATVTEYGTDKIELSKAKTYVVVNPYTLHFNAEEVFQPGLPYEGEVLVNNVHTRVEGHVVEICYNVAIKKSWNYLNNEQCTNFTLQKDLKIPFSIMPLKDNIVHVYLTTRSINNTAIGASFTVVRLFSTSSSYVKINQVEAVSLENSCRSSQQFDVEFTINNSFKKNDNLTMFYMIKSRGQIHKLRRLNLQIQEVASLRRLINPIGKENKFLTAALNQQKTTIKFKLDEQISSSYQLLVYYITRNGEVIAASKDITLKPCPRNGVSAAWSQKQITPGARIALTITASSDSLCSVSAIDKSMKLIDHSPILSTDSLYKSFQKERETMESGRKACLPPVRQKKNVEALTVDESDIEESTKKPERKKRHVFPYSEFSDAYDMINKFGIVTITNFKLVTKTCYTGPRLVLAPITGQYSVQVQNEDKVASIRSFFPETWLWELVPVRTNATIYRDVPHTITKWVTNAICVSATEGVGVSTETELTAFQPFFIDVLTPYSIKRGEVLYLHAMVFNYLPYNLPIRVTLKELDTFKLVDLWGRSTVSFCISSNSSRTHIFELKPTKIGAMNLTIMAEIDGTYPGQCGPEVLVNKKDVVIKMVQVLPEGYSKTVTKSAVICSSDKSPGNVTWFLEVPDNAVPESINSRIILNAELLGQTIENLDELVNIPTGCGEQIMASLAPNLYILQYLNATKNLPAMLRQRIIKNLKIGYQRILNYVHRDGSFSAFGYHDPMGSMFLTAFVVRTLCEAKHHIYVDQRLLDRSVAWIFAHQLENGCFHTMLHVFQDMGGTTNENSSAALTAYVIISLLDANVPIPAEVAANAKYCIRGYYQLDAYTLAISAYALLKLQLHQEAARLLRRLVQTAETRGGMLWWVGGGEAASVEVTGYVLLALLEYRTQENLAHAHSVARWLSSRQGPRGGFSSTQDTAVALAALARYWALFAQPTRVDVAVEVAGRRHVFSVRGAARARRVDLDAEGGTVGVRVEGSGCVLAQSVLTYYMRLLPSGGAFKLEVEAASVSTVDKCAIATLAPCFLYDGPEARVNMAILEVDLPSGYNVDRASLYQLVDENKFNNIKMFEENDQKVVFYLTELSHQQICINFNINENTLVQGKVESTVKLYDYYKPEYSVLRYYKLNECKPNNSTIPELAIISKSETSKNKRDVGLNPDFVDSDVELQFPDGIESNTPVYIKPNFTKVILNVENSIERQTIRVRPIQTP